jgi:hypothetical protein
MMLTGKERIAADRMWRNPVTRLKFERETGTDYTKSATAEYSESFRSWAAEQLMDGYSLTIIPRSWECDIWRKPHKTIVAFGPLRFVWHRALGPWKTEFGDEDKP